MADLGRMTVTVNLEKVPEIIWQIRREMAQVLRETAEAEADPRVARRLVEVAIAFESGQGT